MIFGVTNRAERANFWRVTKLAEFGRYRLNRANRTKSY